MSKKSFKNFGYVKTVVMNSGKFLQRKLRSQETIFAKIGKFGGPIYRMY